MSDLELAAIHEKTSAILEKLYDENCQPDEAFVQKYFALVQDILGDSDGEAEGPHTTEAKLSEADKGLIDVLIPSKAEKLLKDTRTNPNYSIFLYPILFGSFSIITISFTPIPSTIIPDTRSGYSFTIR